MTKKIPLKLRLVLSGFFILALWLLFPWAKVNAASAQFDLLPGKNPIALDEEVNINVFLNTGGNSLTTARIVLNYDPDIIQVTAAKHGDLFCDYPTDSDSYYINNAKGTLKITGFCETDSYSSSEFELFAKITFKGVSKGRSDIEAEYSQVGAVDETAAFDDKSPPQNVLNTEPSKIILAVGETYSGGTVPSTGLDHRWVIYVSAFIAIIGTGLYFLLREAKKPIK